MRRVGDQIATVTVNHEERNFFNDYGEIRSDMMVGVEPEKVARAIDKMVRRHRKDRLILDCMLVQNHDNTGWRLMYGYDPELFEKGIEERFLRLRHYTDWYSQSWDTEESVSVAAAKKAILGGQE